LLLEEVEKELAKQPLHMMIQLISHIELRSEELVDIMVAVVEMLVGGLVLVEVVTVDFSSTIQYLLTQDQKLL
jgi:hypothetical protein